MIEILGRIFGLENTSVSVRSLDSVFTSTYSSVYTVIYSRMFYRLLPPGGTKLIKNIS
jgi:hypothetical protein